jgi:hypothetical protein
VVNSVEVSFNVDGELPMDVLDSVGIGFEGVVGTSEVEVFDEGKDTIVGLSVENRVEGGL